MSAPVVACASCTGVSTHRVKTEGSRDPRDDFDQITDHRSPVFTSAAYLASVAESGSETVTVWRLADSHRGGVWPEDTVIAYAGPHPGKPGERVWLVDLSGAGLFADLLVGVR